MKTKARVRQKEPSAAMAFGIGVAAVVVTELLLLMLAASLTSAGVIPEGGMKPTAAVCALLSTFLGGLVGAGRVSRLKLPLALGVSVVVLAIHVALGRASAEGTEGLSLVQTAVFPIGGILSGCLSAKAKKKRR